MYLPGRTQGLVPIRMNREREFFIDNLLVRIHFINTMMWWTGLAPQECESPFPGSHISTFPNEYLRLVLARAPDVHDL